MYSRRKIDPYSVTPESRLYWLLYTAPLEAIGLFGFAWTTLPPEEYQTHWIGRHASVIMYKYTNKIHSTYDFRSTHWYC